MGDVSGELLRLLQGRDMVAADRAVAGRSGREEVRREEGRLRRLLAAGSTCPVTWRAWCLLRAEVDSMGGPDSQRVARAGVE